MFQLPFIEIERYHPQKKWWGFHNSENSFINSGIHYPQGGAILHNFGIKMGVIYHTGGGIVAFNEGELYSTINENIKYPHFL